MRVAILSESTADEAAVRVLVDSALGLLSTDVPAEAVPRSREKGGKDSVFRVLPYVIRGLHFSQMADALVVVVDGDGTPLDATASDSDLVELRRLVSNERARLAKRGHACSLRVAIGVAYPAIEAWYRWHKTTECSETAWQRSQSRGAHAPTRIRQLKREKYGVEWPDLPLETERAVANCRASTDRLDELAGAFPLGLKTMIDEICSWRSIIPPSCSESP